MSPYFGFSYDVPLVSLIDGCLFSEVLLMGI